MSNEASPKRGRSKRLAGWMVGVCLGCLAFAGVAVAALVAMLTPPHLPLPPQADLVISGVTIINPGLSRTGHQTIVVRNGRIAEVRAARPDDPAPICAGCFAMPGLIDAHVHTPPAIAIGNQQLFALLYLAYGVTSVRDLGELDSSVAAWAERLNSGKEAGPRVYRCGPVLDGREPTWPFATSITEPLEARRVVQRLAREGVDCIKVYSHVDTATFAAISATAAQEGLPLIGHVPHLVGLRGISNFEAQHLSGIPYLHRDPPWPTADREDSALASMSDGEIEEALSLARTRNVSLTPTIANSTLRLVITDSDRFPPPPAAQHLPDVWRQAWPSVIGYPKTEAEIEARMASDRKLREISRRARLRGIDVLAGTDTLGPYTIPGESLLLEIDQLARAFADNEAALAAATLVNGRHIDNGQIGVVAAGARADILLLPQDPVKDLNALRGWRILIAAGRKYERPALETQLRTYDRHFHSSVYETVFGAIVDLVEARFRSNATTEASN